MNVDLAVTKITMMEREDSQVGSMAEPGFVLQIREDHHCLILLFSHVVNEGELLKGLLQELNMLRQCNRKN